jgi:hypothetical protein
MREQAEHIGADLAHGRFEQELHDLARIRHERQEGYTESTPL